MLGSGTMASSLSTDKRSVCGGSGRSSATVDLSNADAPTRSPIPIHKRRNLNGNLLETTQRPDRLYRTCAGGVPTHSARFSVFCNAHLQCGALAESLPKRTNQPVGGMVGNRASKR